MSLVKAILRINARYFPLGHAEIYEYLYNESVSGRKINKRSLSTTLSRMKTAGLLSQENSLWSPTADGLISAGQADKGPRQFSSSEKFTILRNRPKRLIVMFDIPEKRKGYRDWLRMELVGFGFILIQKSVWLGPSLPKEFIKYLDEIGLLKHIRFFRATEDDLM